MEKAKRSFSCVNLQKRTGNKIDKFKEEMTEVDQKRLIEAEMVIFGVSE